MELGNVLYTFTLLIIINYIYCLEWHNDVPIVEETDCVPRCIDGGICAYDPSAGSTYCTCPDKLYYHETLGCQKLFSSTSECDWNTNDYIWIKTGILTHKLICPCKPGHFRRINIVSCVKKRWCQGVTCPVYTKCRSLNTGEGVCDAKEGYYLDPVFKIPFRNPVGKDDPKNKCIPPALPTPTLNENGPDSVVCSCPDDMYLTKNMRQCAKLETFEPNHVYTVKLEDPSKVFPKTFDLHLDGCFDVRFDQPQDRLVYHSREMVNDLDVNVKIPKDIRSLHFKLTNTTLDIYANDNKNMHPLFSTYFTNVNCKFLFNTILQEEDSSNLIKTATRMDVLAHPRLNKFAV